jgi:hypothetical protein
MSKPKRYTIILPQELDRELNQISAETGVALADLLRQGGIRVVAERSTTGSVKLMQMPKSELAA